MGFGKVFKKIDFFSGGHAFWQAVIKKVFARKPDGQNFTENRVGALRIQTSTQGIPITIAYGTNRLTPNMIWYGDFTSIAHTETSQGGGGGGKGGGGGQAVTTTRTTYTYTVGLLLGLCEGPVPYFGEGGPYTGKVWSNKTVTTAGSPGLGFHFYFGTYSQDPEPFIVDLHPDEALAYRGLVYLAHPAFDLGDNPGVPNITVEVRALPGSTFLAEGPQPEPCAPDVNPAYVLSDLLRAEHYGASFPWVSLLEDFLTYCAASNFLVSPVFAAQQPAAEIVKELCSVGNSAPVWSDGILKVKPYGDETVTYTPSVMENPNADPIVCLLGDTVTYTPDLTPAYDLGVSDFLADAGEDPVKLMRTRQSDAFNVVQVSILDRDNDYNDAVVEASDLAAIEKYGRRVAPMMTLHSVCNIEIGRAIAQITLQRLLYVRNTYEFSLPWNFARLEPMDIVTLTEPHLSLDAVAVRITSVEEDERGRLTLTAEDLSVGSASATNYGTQASGGAVLNDSVDPGDAVEPVVFQPPVELSGVPQVWIGSSGGPNWGGAEVWTSDEGSSYALAGTIGSKARFGVLTANFPATGDPDTTSALSVDLSASGGVLVSATDAQADGLDTLSYVDGELIAYSQANLTGLNTYDLTTYIRRGLRCTLASAHEAGTNFMRLDGAICKIPITPSRVGNTIGIKLLSFNTLGRGLQTLDQAEVYEYVVQPLGVVATNGTLPSTIEASQSFCVAPTAQFSVIGRFTVLGHVNCDGRIVIL